MFTKNKKLKKVANSLYGTTIQKGYAEPIFYNDSVHIIFEACKSCYNITREMSYEEIKTYIGKRISAGHDSILEHSNIIIKVSDVGAEYKDDLLTLTTAQCNPCKYLKVLTPNMAVGIEEDEAKFDVIFQGSVRAFKHLMINWDWNRDNIFISHIRNCLYTCTIKEYWHGVSEEYMEPDKFVDNIYVGDEDEDPENIVDITKPFTLPVPERLTNDLRIINMDPLESIFRVIYNKAPSDTILENWHEDEDLLEMGTITVDFMNMSRTATHQLVRHRNAITQESQRYVDYSKAGFTTPRVDYLRDNELFSVCFNGETKLMSLEELGQEIIGLYSQLRNQGLKKEDARAFLPGNVQCKQLYMTFTYRSLFKFLELRCEKHAQEEIRTYALEILDTLCDLQTFTPSEELKNELGEAANKLRSIYWIPGILALRYNIRMKNEEYGEVKE